jgi:hypothetical protein
MQIRKRRIVPDVFPALSPPFALGAVVSPVARPIARRRGSATVGVLPPLGQPFSPRSILRPVARRVPPRRGAVAVPRFAPPFVPVYTHVQGSGTHGIGIGSLAQTFGSPVSIGDLVIVSASTYSNSPPTITDSGGNTYTKVAYQYNGASVAIYYSIVTTGGVLTVTASSGGYMSLCVDNYRYSAGALVSVDGFSTATGDGVSASSGAVTPTGTDLIYGVVSNTGNLSSLNPGSGFTSRYSNTGASGYYVSILAEDQFGVTSPTAATMTLSTSNPWACACVAFKAAIPPIFLNPAVVPSNHAGNLSINLVGSGTNWNGTTRFTATGSGVTLVSQSITSNTAATIVVATGSSVGTCTIADGTYSATLSVKSATIFLTPPGVGKSAVQTITALGVNTLWLSEPALPLLFEVAGVAGASITSVAVQSNTTATFTLTTGTSTGTATVTDRSTEATSSVTIYPNTPGITVSPSFVPIGKNDATLVLTGVDTNWVSGTTLFTLAGVAGVTLVSQSITSSTAATIVVTTGFTTGTATIFDGSYEGTVAVTLSAVVSQAYVSRNGQTAYFLTTGTTGTYPAYPLVPTYTIINTAVTAGGSGYTSPSAMIAGGIALTLTNGGSAYTSAPTVTLSGGGGTGASAVATIASGIGLTLTGGGSGYTSAPTVTITGGSGFGATATASINGSGVVTGFTVTPGSGFIGGQPPTVAITGGGGSGATATAYIPSGAVSGFTVTPG